MITVTNKRLHVAGGGGSLSVTAVRQTQLRRSEIAFAKHVKTMRGFAKADWCRKVRAALAACVRLIRFYRQNREIPDKAASESFPDLARRR